MMRVRVLAPNVTFGKVGDVVDVPAGVSVRALIKSGAVELAPPKPKKKAAAKKKVSD